MINWINRYRKILNKYPDLFDPNKSVLEVGCGGYGISQYLKRPVIGLDRTFPENIDKHLIPVKGTITDICFPDDSFDLVVCVDVMEHLPPQVRQTALKELVRVSRGTVIVACPCGHIAMTGEKKLLQSYGGNPDRCPDWLKEHLDNGLPTVGDIVAGLADLGYAFEIIPNESMMQHYAGILLDDAYPFARELLAAANNKGCDQPPIGECEWDHYYSFIFTLHKTRKRASAPPRAKEPGPVKSIQVYSVYHRDFPTNHLSNTSPIFVGAFADQAPPGALTDRRDHGPPLRNDRWCELTAIYKIWRDGPRTDMIGFCHYRRLFNFETSKPRDTIINHADIKSYTIPTAELSKLEGAIVLPAPYKLDFNIFDQYCMYHNTNDICLLYSIIIEKHPYLIQHMNDHFTTSHLFSNNMFIATWDDFNELCTIWFDVMSAFETLVEPKNANAFQKRDIGFLSERVFDLWVRHKERIGTKLYYTGVYCLHFDDTTIGDWTPIVY